MFHSSVSIDPLTDRHRRLQPEAVTQRQTAAPTALQFSEPPIGSSLSSRHLWRRKIDWEHWWEHLNLVYYYYSFIIKKYDRILSKILFKFQFCSVFVPATSSRSWWGGQTPSPPPRTCTSWLYLIGKNFRKKSKILFRSPRFYSAPLDIGGKS